MSTHNIGFYEEISKIIFELSSNIIKSHLISSSGLYYLHAGGEDSGPNLTAGMCMQSYKYLCLCYMYSYMHMFKALWNS